MKIWRWAPEKMLYILSYSKNDEEKNYSEKLLMY